MTSAGLPRSFDELCLGGCNSYFDRHVPLAREEKREAVARVTSVVNDILRYVHDEDERFKGIPETTGSHRQRLKVTKPDEFDYNVKLSVDTSSWVWSSARHRRFFGFNKSVEDPVLTMDNTLRIVTTNDELPPPSDGYVTVYSTCVQGTGLRWEELCFGETVIPFLIRKRLRQLMVDAQQQSPELQGKVSMSKKLAGPALSFRIDGADKEREISVDLSPYFDLPHLWSNRSDWPRPKTRSWLSAEKLSKVRARGVQLVPKKNFDWFVSFSHAETELLDGIDADGGCRRKCLRLFKHLNSSFFSNAPTKPTLSSHILKNIWMWECEEEPSSKSWAPDMLWLRLKGLVCRLRNCLYKKEAPLYFNSAFNMLSNKDKEELDVVKDVLENFLRDPLQLLRK